MSPVSRLIACSAQFANHGGVNQPVLGLVDLRYQQKDEQHWDGRNLVLVLPHPAPPGEKDDGPECDCRNEIDGEVPWNSHPLFLHYARCSGDSFGYRDRVVIAIVTSDVSVRIA
jgi:hypothetical protein